MKQIYEIIATLIKNERNLNFFPKDNYDPRDTAIEIEYRIMDLENQERAFICTMIAFSKENLKKQLSYKMNSQWFMSHKTYYVVRQQLIDKHVIVKLGNKHKYVLNPDYHPALSKERLADISKEVSEQLDLMYKEAMKRRDLGLEP